MQSDLFVRLARRGFLHRLVDLHEAAGERPGAEAGLDRAAQQQDASTPLRYDADDQHRVDVMNMPAVAHQARPVLGLDQADDEGGAAAGTVAQLLAADVVQFFRHASDCTGSPPSADAGRG